MNDRHPKIAKDVLEKIKKGNIRMRSGRYFALLTAMSAVAVTAASILLSYLFSALFFWTKIITSDSRAFGARRNLSEIMSSFPWWTIPLTIILAAFIVVMIRNFGTIYRHKISHIIIILVLISLFLSLVMSSFGVGDLRHQGQPKLLRNNWPHNKNSIF